MSPVTGRQWRSLEELSRDPAFLAEAVKEFPHLREAVKAQPGRRDLLRFLGAALAMGGLAGCYSGEPGGVLIPAVRIPPDTVPGVPDYYATAHVNAGYALGTVVKHWMGRPIKVEGNPNHPASLGATDAFSQAEVISFYDPAREMALLQGGEVAARQPLMAAIAAAKVNIHANKGAGFRVLTGTVTSPTMARLIERILSTYPGAQWHQWEPINQDNLLRGAQIAYGQPVEVAPKLDAADVVLAIDSDLFEGTPGWVSFARAFASRRNPVRTRTMSRVYAIEGVPSLIGVAGDHRFIAGPREIWRIVGALSQGVLHNEVPGGAPPWLTKVVEDLRAHHGGVFIHAGRSQPPEVHALVHVMNEALGGRGKTYELLQPVAHRPESHLESITTLARDMHAGRVDTLLVIDTNPVFTAPPALDFGGAMKRTALSIALTRELNETAAAAIWAVPGTHQWEAWGDARAFEGTATIIQPQALPLWQGTADVEMLALFSETLPPAPAALVRETWRKVLPNDEAWRDALTKGVVPGTASPPAQVNLRPEAASATPKEPPQGLALELRADPALWDGRYADNPWLQETPRPLTKLTWDNPLLIAPAVAQQMKLQNGDRVLLKADGRSMTVPVWINPGQAPDVLAAWVGNGRRVTSGVGREAGFDFYQMSGASGPVTLERAKGNEQLASTQHHNFLTGNEAETIVRHADLETFQKTPGFAKRETKPQLYWRKPSGPEAWAMTVDLNACIGCNACVVACQAENNVPTVGKGQVIMEREMHWLRIDRYFEGSPDDPQTFFQPMLCMMCEKAPCELVCPPGATVHSEEGLNVMVYNRCIGTRFCSNNCPYKVRRFNFYQYSYDANRPAVSWNPEVTVRQGGVMEKCTFCVQRIAKARIDADRQNRPIPPDSFTTACAQACPTQVFTFGNMNDPKATVTSRKHSPLDYELFEDQHTHPRTTYEARVLNPNPAISKDTA